MSDHYLLSGITKYPLNLFTRTYMVHGGRNFLAVPERAFQTDFISASLVNIKTGVGIVELGPGYENHIV